MSHYENGTLEELSEVLLKNPDLALRREAANELGKRSAPQIIKPLIQALGDHEDVAIFATLALVKIGEKVIPELKESLHSSNEQIRGYSAEILGELDAEEALADLIEVVQKDESPWVRNSAVEALGRLKSDQALNILKNLLDSQDNLTVVTSAIALHRMGYKDNLFENLLNRLEFQTEIERGITSWALVEICGKSHLELLQDKYNGSEDTKLKSIYNEIIRGISLK